MGTNTLEIKVKRFHEACRITSKYDNLKDVLEEIEACLEEEACNPEALKIKEVFKSLIPLDKSDKSIKSIIRWCLAQGYLQQAVTMTAEWFPRYALAAGVFKIVDPKVKDENETQRQPWDTWTGNLFKTYNPYSNTANSGNISDIDLANLSVKDLRKIIKETNYKYWDIYKIIKGHNKSIETFMDELIKVGVRYPQAQFPAYVVSLNKDSSLKVICSTKYNVTGEENLYRLIEKNIKNYDNPVTYILHLLSEIKSETIKDLFGLKEENKPRRPKTDEETEEKIASRKAVFKKLLDEDKIASSNPTLFLEIVEKQVAIIEFYRNRMNHGVIKFEGIEGNKEIQAKVEELLKLAETLES